MKKILLIICLLLTGCSKDTKNYISKVINLDVKSCIIEDEKDTHSGFLGDGDYFAKLDCSKVDNFEISDWKDMPLSSNIDEVMNLVQCSDECKSAKERYNIKEINNGYYYFVDRHGDSTDKYDDKDLNNRPSYNFSLALYDEDNKIIYYYELDT